jgi:hypothetical protein
MDHPNDPNNLKSRLFEVTENLFQGLRQIPMGPNEIYIWADAICIDQSNNAEKSWQVAMMWSIYQKAQTVRVWLGSAADASNHFMDVMNTLIQKLADNGKDHPLEGYENWRTPETFSALREFESLTNRPYWTRSWTRQEISAQSVDKIWIHCGRRSSNAVYFTIFLQMFRNLAMDVLAKKRASHNISPTEQLVSEIANSEGFTFMDSTLRSSLSEKARYIHILETWLRTIYLWGNGLRATDPRDLVYSLYSMTFWDKEDYAKLSPDYDKDCRAVYVEVTEHFLQSGWSSILAWRNRPSPAETPRDVHLESWVVDWRSPIRPVHYLTVPGIEGSTEHQYDATKKFPGPEFKSTYRIDKNPNGRHILRVPGYILDTIQFIGEPLLLGESPWRARQVQIWTQQLMDLYSKGKKTEPTEESGTPSVDTGFDDNVVGSVYRNLWRIPVLDVEYNIDAAKLTKASSTMKAEFATLMESPMNRTYTEDEALFGSYCEIAREVCPGKRFFVTKKGYAGIAFDAIKPGQVVALIPGLEVPLILTANEEGLFNIISDSYVEGVMYGEMRGEVQQNILKKQELMLV